ncbi:MAG: ankyrin repeat domain-containing protein, partial [Bacteroidales bacterium]|nr:ankyrin repeat domain-containing protein [Bacteroidales bacterium]
MSTDDRSAAKTNVRAAITRGDVGSVAAYLDDPQYEESPVARQQTLNVWFQFALWDRQSGVAELLADRGADLNTPVIGKSTVLDDAAGRGDLPAVQWLCELGADVNGLIHGQPGSWSLLSAAHGGHLDVVRYLVEHGAVVNFVNGFGLSPLDYAMHFQHPEVAAFLRSVGALPGSELPRDHLPKDEPEPAEPSRNSTRDHLTVWFEGVSEYPLREIIPGDPPLSLLHVPQWDGGYVAIVTDGASARPMPVPASDPNAVRRAEY